MTAPGDGGFWTAAGGVIVVLAIRLIDWLLPQGGHFHTPWNHHDDEEAENVEHDY